MKICVVIALTLMTFFGGCYPSYEILQMTEGDGGVYLTFPAGSHLEEGQVFRIVGAVGRDTHGRARPILGRVKVLQVTDETVAFVKLIEGTVENGVSAEKVE